MKRKKTVILSILAGVVLILIAVGIFVYPYLVSQNFHTVLGYNPSDVSRIYLRNGNTGLHAEITDSTEIGDFLSLFNDVPTKKYWVPFRPSQRAGYSLSVRLYDLDGNQLAWFTCGTFREIADLTADQRYRMDRPLTSEQIDPLLVKYKIDIEERKRLNEEYIAQYGEEENLYP